MRNIIEKIFEKESLEENDIGFLVQNKHLLTQEELIRLGLEKVIEVEEVKEIVDKETIEVTEETEQEEVKKRGRPKRS